MREPRKRRSHSTFSQIALLAVTLSSGCGGDPFTPGPVITIEGVVYNDATSAPVPGARVSLLTNCVFLAGCGPSGTSFTDAAGAYLMRDTRKQKCATGADHAAIQADDPRGSLGAAQAVYKCTAAVQRIDFRLKPFGA